MKAKKPLVFFLTLASLLVFISALVSATPIGSITRVEIDGVNVNQDPAIIAGETIVVRVDFVSNVNASDIEIRAEIESSKKDVEARTKTFDVESGKTYSKSLRLEVPFDLQDVLSDSVTLNIRISGSGYRTDASYTLRLQREPFNVDIKSVNVPQTVKAGETFPIDFVLKNIGYNDLTDLFVTAKIPALNIEKKSFVGDLVALECDEDSTAVENYGVNVTRKCNEDDTDTVSGRVFLQLPYGVRSGVYALELMVENEDTTSSKTVQLEVKNAFSSGNFIVSGNQLLIVNPTNEVVVYRLIPESIAGVSIRLSESVVAVPAGSSKTVTVEATSNVVGTQVYSVNVFTADGKLVDTVSFSLTTEGETRTSSSPIVVLTVILAIIFVVLLVVLIVLIGKKPEKEEFGESYY